MKLSAAGLEISVDRVDINGGEGGYVLLISIPGRHKNNIFIFRWIAGVVEKSFDNVTSSEDLNEEGSFEIRILQGLELPLCLAMITAGIGVKQIS